MLRSRLGTLKFALVSIRDQSVPLASSLIVHLTLLGMLAALVLPGALSAPGASMAGSFLDTTVPDVPSLESISPSPTLDQGGEPSGSSSDQLYLTDITSQSQGMSLNAELPLPLKLNAVGLPTGSLTRNVGNGTAGTGRGGHGGGSGTGGGQSFFGVQDSAKSTVFVVDASGSMNMPHPGRTGTRFGRVKMELLATITQMSKDQKFFIIFFNSQAIPMPADRLMEATTAAQQQYLEWMAQVPARSGTFPGDALLMALSLKPDVIYFLTDGQFDSRVVQGVTNANRTGIPIHTIGFSDEQGEALLKEIANRNRGTYQFIPSDEAFVAEPQPGAAQAKSAVSQWGS